ncbi:unnamed protein product [Sphagnum troendelagicum]|uniref:Secreted protein n=1 Tax=Sphagnum troendelagicum TaxID=128251 RepID=A0ABP0U3A5_9BRYO
MGIIFKAFPLHQQILHLLLCSAVLTSSLFLSPNSALGSFIRGHATLNCILSDNINPFCCFHKMQLGYWFQSSLQFRSQVLLCVMQPPALFLFKRFHDNHSLDS